MCTQLVLNGIVLQAEVNQYWNTVDASLSAGYVESQYFHLLVVTLTTEQNKIPLVIYCEVWKDF